MRKIVALLVAYPHLVWAQAPTGPSETLAAPQSETSPDADAKPSAAEAAAPSDAAEGAAPELGYAAEVDVASRCLWRGLAYSEYPVLQPSASLSKYGATFGLAGLGFLGSEPGVDNRFAELDLLASYELTLDAATFSPSFSVYTYPGEADTAELGASLSYDLKLITLQTHQSLDVASNAGGWYGDFGASRSQPLGAHLTLDTLASLAWFNGSFSRYYVDDAIDGMHLGAAMLDSSLVLSATDSVYFRLHGTLSRMLEENVRSLAPDQTLVAGGLAMGIAH
jgi:hypothetical protein